MIRFNLKLLPENISNSFEIASSNQISEKSYNHLKTLIGGLRCKKHPSFKNVINVVAVEGKDPKIEIVNICCQDFYNSLGR
jgi:hypothetical protein